MKIRAAGYGKIKKSCQYFDRFYDRFDSVQWELSFLHQKFLFLLRNPHDDVTRVGVCTKQTCFLTFRKPHL